MLSSIRRLLIAALFVLSSCFCFSQKVTTLSGNIKGLDLGSKVYLSPRSSSLKKDSSIVTSDSFQFKLNIEQGDAYFITYRVKSQRFDYVIYMKNGSDVHLNSNLNTNFLLYSGSDLAVEQNDFYKGLLLLNQEETDLVNELPITKDSIKIYKLNLEKKSFVIKSEEFYENWLKNHNNSPFSVAVICLFMQDGNVKTEVLEKLYNDLSLFAKENNLVSNSMPMFFARMRSKEMMKQGEPIKDFILKDTSGIAHSFNSLKGDNYVLLDLWASWCGPCRKSTPEIKKLLTDYSNYNFKVISISADTDSEKWKDAIVQDQMNWSQLSDLKDTEDCFMKGNKILGYPTYILVSPQGIIISKPWSIEKVKEVLANIFSKEK